MIRLDDNTTVNSVQFQGKEIIGLWRIVRTTGSLGQAQHLALVNETTGQVVPWHQVESFDVTPPQGRA